ncbi:MAG: 1-(5-phosphoribosyl)-5-amino-4-imidazole-carboxylate carboxylase, partial [Magnetococcales bacterium]|nr:1-(5-phosphoribosyl)-5-amino-4-imidazole-carboxylate carboxylase [Magnetococcales bacterium]
MSPEKIKALLDSVAAGTTSVEEASTILQRFPMDEVVEQGQVVARLDTHRRIRQGFAEVIFAEGKEFSHLARLTERALQHGEDFLMTRVSPKR